MHDTGVRTCAHEGCDKSFKANKWAAIKAYDEGWFLQKNGKCWCPDHVPEWVAGWRG